MRRFCDARADWLTVVQLPAYAPELNAAEGVWAHVKRDLGNLLVGTVDELAASAKRLLKRIQYRPELIDGFRAQTGLASIHNPRSRPGLSTSVLEHGVWSRTHLLQGRGLRRVSSDARGAPMRRPVWTAADERCRRPTTTFGGSVLVPRARNDYLRGRQRGRTCRT